MSYQGGDGRLFEGQTISEAYKKYRPTYSGSGIREKIIAFLQEKHQVSYDLAVDLGCGSGQSSHYLASHFKNVIGVDCSEAQIKEAQLANTASNVTFRCGDESGLGSVADSSVDLVSCGQSIHWMDLDALYPEVRRILKPGGCLAAYGYLPEDISSTEDAATITVQLQEIYDQVWEWLRPYLSRKLDVLNDGYVDLALPFAEHKRYSDFTFSRYVTIDGVIGLIKSFSAYNLLIEERPEEIDTLHGFRTKFLDIIRKVSDSPEEYSLTLTSKTVLLMSRKPTTE